MRTESDHDLTSGAGLIACPRCDALHIERNLAPGDTARCLRCNAVLASPRGGAFALIIALSLASLALMVGAVFFPFMQISRFGFGNETSLFGVALALSQEGLLPLTVAFLAAIVGLPMLRAMLLLYTLLPLACGRPPLAHAARAFRLSEALRHWSMVEIFAVGAAIALVKVGGLANIGVGPAFWAFCWLIVVNAASNATICAATIWNAIEAGGKPGTGPRLLPGPPA